MTELKEKITNSIGNDLAKLLQSTDERELEMLVTYSPEFILLQDTMKMQNIMCLMPHSVTEKFIKNNAKDIVNKIKKDNLQEFRKGRIFIYQNMSIFDTIMQQTEIRDYLLSLQTTSVEKATPAPFTSIFENGMPEDENNLNDAEANIIQLINDDMFKEKIVKIGDENEYNVIINKINSILKRIEEMKARDKEHKSGYSDLYKNVYINLSQIKEARAIYHNKPEQRVGSAGNLNPSLYKEDRTRVFLIDELAPEEIKNVNKQLKEINDGTLYGDNSTSLNLGEFTNETSPCQSFTTLYMQKNWFIGIEQFGEVCSRALGEPFSNTQTKCFDMLCSIANQRGLSQYTDLPVASTDGSIKR